VGSESEAPRRAGIYRVDGSYTKAAITKVGKRKWIVHGLGGINDVLRIGVGDKPWVDVVPPNSEIHLRCSFR
jgi:hypothetical protein